MRIVIVYGEDEWQWSEGAKETSWSADQVLFLGLSGGYMDVIFLWKSVKVTTHDVYTFLYVCYSLIKKYSKLKKKKSNWEIRNVTER